MRVLIMCQWFPPEPAPIGVMLQELGRDLCLQGHKVTIITGFPNHPQGVLYPGYKQKLYMKEQIDGAEVIRCYVYIHPRKNFLHRILNYASFAVTSFVAALLSGKHDILFLVSPPLSNGIVGILLKKIKQMRFIFNVQDIYPDVAISTGVVKNPLLIWILRKFETYTYNIANRVVVISDGFKKNLLEKGISDDGKIQVIPNWIDTEEIVPVPRDNHFAREHGLLNKFIVLYSGTIGLISGAEIMVECAEQLKEYTDILVLFVGEGVAKDNLVRAAKQKNLNNMKFLPFQPRELLSQMQSSADVSLLTLQKGKGKTSVPSKVLGFMAAAKPIIASVDLDSDTARIIEEAQCGICVNAESAREITDSILYLYNNRDEAHDLGNNGRSFLVNNFTRKIITSQYEKLFCSVVGGEND